MPIVRTAATAVLLGLGAVGTALSAPTNGAAVKIEGDLSQHVLNSAEPGKIYLRLSLKSLALREKERRTPVNVALVLDRSGSMQGERIVAAREAAGMALDRLTSKDIVSLIAYNHGVDIVAPAAKLGADHARLKAAIAKLQADGTTALYAGVKEGARQVAENLERRKINRVVLMSDGLANVGPSTPKELAELGKELASRGITVTTIGLGLDYNEDLMQRLAGASDGNHAFAEKPEDLVKFFNAEFGDALAIAAQDITITIECKLGFKPIRLLGREGAIDGSKVTVKLSQLQAGNERYVVLELEAPAGAKAGEAEVADVGVTYLNLDDGQTGKTDLKISTRFSASKEEAEASINKEVLAQVTAQIATEATEKAVELRDQGDIAAARRTLEDNAAYIKKSNDAVRGGAAPAAAASVQTLDELEKKSREAAANLDDDNWNKTRKDMRYDQHKRKVQQTY